MEESLEYIINHVFLPPKLPQSDDSDPLNDYALTKELLSAMRSFQDSISAQDRLKWDHCTKMLDVMLAVRDETGVLHERKIASTLMRMKDGEVFALMIRGQNAGLIIRRLHAQYSFESFELSPIRTAVFRTNGRLRRCFPGPAVSIDSQRVLDPSFHEPLCSMLEGLDTETPEEVRPIVMRAGSEVLEERETADPRMVTGMVIGMLQAIGQPLKVRRIYKHTRDDALWKDAKSAWRRSPLWLLLRVALQTILSYYEEELAIDRLYKMAVLVFHTHILKAARKVSFPSQILFVMLAKISHRLLKMEDWNEPELFQHVGEAMESAQTEMAGRWSLIEQNQDPASSQLNWRPLGLNFVKDCALTLTKLRPYLEQARARATSSLTQESFSPECRPRIASSLILPDRGLLDGVNKHDIYLALSDLESWIQENLRPWLEQNIYKKETCNDLSKLIVAYISTASPAYIDLPEETSLMLLTTIDLWVALDECAVRHYPILLKYDPEFPAALFDPLLLPRKPQMEQLRRVEKYIAARRKAAFGSPSVHRSLAHPHGLSVRYFDQSRHHQDLRRTIEAEGGRERIAKREEFRSKREMFTSLRNEASLLEHECESIRRGRRVEDIYDSDCERCRLENRAKSITIDLHEWPLPAENFKAKAAVFELDVPTEISIWRNITFTLLNDVFSTSNRKKKQSKAYGLHDFPGLQKYAKHDLGRLQVFSERKPFLSSHYQTQVANHANDTRVCVQHGSVYAFLDTKDDQWTEDAIPQCDILDTCTFKLPHGPYKGLQHAIEGTKYTSNSVIANQSDCHKSLTMHEFYSFATLRSGCRLQWSSIAREIRARVLQFKCDEVNILFTHAALQAGPAVGDEPCRDSHADLGSEGFGRDLLTVLNEGIGTIEGNWQGDVALRLFVLLATRLLSMSSHDTVRQGCLDLLRRARSTSLRWTRELGQKLHEVEEEAESKTLNRTALALALTVHGTFDVDSQHIASVLNSDEDAAILSECSVIIHDRSPPTTDHLSVMIRTLLRRFHRLAARLEPSMQHHILLRPGILHNAVRQIWPVYRPELRWASLASPSERWLVTTTACEDGLTPRHVEYNLLTGSLLVNGKPLARLPPAYEEHPTFRRLFGPRILEVVPIDMESMTFEARSEIHGNQVQFGMHNGELIVRARSQGRVYELIPTHALQDDFPLAFVEDFVHWRNVDTETVEWCPLNNRWSIPSENWRTQLDTAGRITLSHNRLTLVDVRTPTAKALSRILSPLESPQHIHIFQNSSTKGLEINLPRLKLDFYLKAGANRLESKQFRGMFVDVNQAVGTMTGLINKLVLCEENGSSRSFIVPDGAVKFQREGHHVRVKIFTSAERTVPYFLYEVDSQLGRIVDDGSLKSKLYKCYLHAVTAHCLVDKLTGRTGTEEALTILAAPSVRSFTRLGKREIDLLQQIADLTPRRQYYPPHLEIMQTVHWIGLSPLSQHDSFSTLTSQIFQRAESLNALQEKPAVLPARPLSGDQFLLERAAVRNSIFRVDQYGAEDQANGQDDLYSARDMVTDSQALQVLWTAKLVDEWSVSLGGRSSLLSKMTSWNETIQGCLGQAEFCLGYKMRWLDSPAEFLPECWCQLQRTLSSSERGNDKYKIMIFLSTLAYSQNSDQDIVKTLLAFATVPQLRAIEPPRYGNFPLAQGFEPDEEKLKRLVHSKAQSYQASVESRSPRRSNETERQAKARREGDFVTNKANCVQRYVDEGARQWVQETVYTPNGSPFDDYIQVGEASKVVKDQWSMWYRNHQFQAYSKRVQSVLDSLSTPTQDVQALTFSPPLYTNHSKRTRISFNDAASKPAPALPEFSIPDFTCWINQQDENTSDPDRLRDLLHSLKADSSAGYERTYAEDLLTSFASLGKPSTDQLNSTAEQLMPVLEEYRRACECHLVAVREKIITCLCSPESPALSLVCEAQMWPRVSPTSLLQQIASVKQSGLSNGWKRCLVQYGLAITTLQRANRMISFIESSNDLMGEFRNPGHQHWDPVQYPDWLLLELECNILIRPVQVQIAMEMISPSSDENSILQMNMGEGKSSVIVPMVAAALADLTKLVRVVVLKPLAAQMFQLLSSKLGNLLGRCIFHMPVSRALRLDISKAEQIRKMCEACLQAGGILLLQPEHLLSFELMGVERLLSGEPELGGYLVKTQSWLNKVSRDILDESDEILSVKFELIYTMGTQRDPEFSPDRWKVIQHILGLLERYARIVANSFPQGLELRNDAARCFPLVRILDPAAGRQLLEMLAGEICENGLPQLPVCYKSVDVRNALRRFITDLEFSTADSHVLQCEIFNDKAMENISLLLRGLVAGGVLTSAFQQKRWRVNYGLDLSRTMLAVPYRAKDTPATRAEFSHPDAAMILTCLSFYHGGLSDSQLDLAFEKLLALDHSEEEYDIWVQEAPTLLDAFRHLSGVNMKDPATLTGTIFPSLRFAKGAIDFFLANIVFPKEMKEFPQKLSTSGWDIARAKGLPTTGFSGTNDSRYILPLSISQCDLPQQLRTNAAVLGCLLRPENNFRHVEQASGKESLDAATLLKFATTSDLPIRVILDVGAQVLEWKNERVAQEWLLRVDSSEAEAAVFFNDTNELSVVSRDGLVESLLVSPFSKRMDQCLIYLDEAHTRGTDLKLPIEYRAAVTLGPDLTKDRLVQACMRLRRLGKGQSVVFCGPMEVERQIRHCNSKQEEDVITVADVLKWSMSNTYNHTKKSVPLWATQGMRYQRRHMAWTDASARDRERSFSVEIAESLLEPEAQSMQDRYGLRSQKTVEESLSIEENRGNFSADCKNQFEAIRARCEDFKLSSMSEAAFQEEQERELSPENEREQQVQRPLALEPAIHSLHQDVLDFVKSGSFKINSPAFVRAFSIFNQTDAQSTADLEAWPNDLFVTKDFAQTVQPPPNQLLDSYLRPVHWILTSRHVPPKTPTFGIVISPFEANELLPLIRKSGKVTLHVYSPRVTSSTRSLESLTFCTIPPLPARTPPPPPPFVRSLNLFAGQLYLATYADYLSLCRFLGLCFRPPRNDEPVRASTDGFIPDPEGRRLFDGGMAELCRFERSPVEFLRRVMAMRRKGLGIERSHLGRMLRGELLRREEWEGREGNVEGGERGGDGRPAA